MHYITLNDLNQTIRKNLYKIPHDIDFVIGVPRSGMLVATIISEFINVPLIDINSFVNGQKPSGGNRLTLLNRSETGKVLVVDDTCYSGASMKNAREKLKDFDYNFIYCCAYLEGKGESEVDIYLDDVRKYTVGSQIPIVLYEWNLMHHYPFISQRCLYDIDGVLCVDPCDERNTEEYEKYIENAVPLYVPSVPIGGFITYRLEKYREVTEKWLKDNGVRYTHLVMFQAKDWNERNQSGISPSMFKGMIYKNSQAFLLFIESDDRQAQEIHQISGKPVLSIEKNILYE